MLPLQYSIRSLWVRRTTTVATASGVALVVFVLAASWMLAEGLRDTLLRAGKPNNVLVLDANAYSESASRMRQSALGLVSAAAGIARDETGAALVSGEVVGHVYLSRAGDPKSQGSIQVRGITAAAYRLHPSIQLLQGRLPTTGTDEAMVGQSLLTGNYTGVALGQGFELKKNRKLQIVGVFAAAGTAYESEVWTDLETVRSTLGSAGFLSAITAQLTAPSTFDSVLTTLTANKQLGLKVERETAYYERVSNGLARGISGLGAVIATILSFGATLGATITFYGSVSQRGRELGVLRALGFSRGQVLLAILIEAISLSLLGSCIGIGLALTTPFLHFSTVNWATGQQLIFRFVPSASALLAAGVAGLGVGLVGGLFPALRAAGIDPVKAMRV